jgi:isopenicillin-N epimerase
MCEPLTDLFLLDRDVVYLNHGSYGACPRDVFDVYQGWQRELERNPVHFIGTRLPGLMQEAREALGATLGVTGDDVVYFANPTTAVRMLCRALPLQPGDEVLTTDWEYPAMDGAWELVARLTGIRYIHQPVPMPFDDPGAWVDALWAGVTPRTRILFLSHIAAFSALIFPVEEVCRRARQAGIMTFIDGAHAPGHIPLNLATLDADLYVGACHKWLCAPKGAGFLYAHPRVQAELAAPLVGNRVAAGEGQAAAACDFVPGYQQQGTLDPSAFLSVPAAIRFQQEHGWDAQRARCHALASQSLSRISAMTRLAPLSPDSPAYYGQMVSIPAPVDRAEAIRQAFADRNIVTVMLRVRGGLLLRVSYQAYNTQEDADTYVEAVAEGLGLQRTQG